MQLNPVIIGRVIRKARKQKGISQDVLSGLASMARTHLTMIESGKKVPNLETIWKIAVALERRPSELVALIEAEENNDIYN